MLNVQAVTEQTRAQLAKTILSGMHDGSLKKSISVPTGLKGINLEAPANQLVPLMSPFRQSIPRKLRPGSDSVTWRKITSISAPKLTSAESAAGALFTTTVTSPNAAYKVMALGGEVTREAEAASQGFDPALAKETANTLLNYMKLEEIYILGGNITTLATPTGLAVAEVNGKGTIGAVTVYARVCALELPVLNRVTVDRPSWDAADLLLAGVAHTDLDLALPAGGGDGVGDLAAEVNSGAMTGTDNAARITWTPVPNAAGYAVFAGTATADANLKLEAIVTQAAVTLTSLNGGGTAATAHNISSGDALSYDGILAQTVAAGSGAYVKNVGGVLTGSSTDGEIVEMGDAFQSIWDNARIGKFRIVCSGIESRWLTARGVSSNALNIITNPLDQGRMNITFGAHVGQIINPVTGDMCPVEAVPWLLGGMMLILPTEIPYADANTSDPFDMCFGYDVERWDYASTRTTGPVFPFEVRSWGALRAIFTGGCGVLYNIYPG